MKSKVMDSLKKAFRPEFINRLDGVMVFRSLTRSEIGMIVQLELRVLCLQLTEQDIKLKITPAAHEAIADLGYDPEYGVRPLRRVIQSELQDELSEGILSHRYVPGDIVEVDYRESTAEELAAEESAEESGDEKDAPTKRFAFNVIDHEDIKIHDPETLEAIEAMLQG